jgi:hypothetical protein
MLPVRLPSVRTVNSRSALRGIGKPIGATRGKTASAERHRVLRCAPVKVAFSVIRPVNSSRFGRLFLVGETGRAFSKLAQAETHARKHPKTMARGEVPF